MQNQKLMIGSQAPNFDLKGIDGKRYSLQSFNKSSVLLIIFNCNHCPYVQAYEQRIINLQLDYREKGLQIVAINSNDDINYPEDSFESMVKRAKAKGFNFIYLRDDTQEIAKAFGATHTPELFLFDKERKLVYIGKIDDNWMEPSKVVTPYLRNAIDEVLKGKPVSVPETFAIGCTIKWK